MAVAKQGNNVSCNHNHEPPWDRYEPAVASLGFDVQNPPSLQRRLAVGAEEEADGPRQDAANLTSLFPFQVLWFNQSSPHKLLWSTFEIRTSAQ
ncbi:hypothetical protein QQF64_034709 [Cirrhinus molitorella]|uniref:Uncharacterized protein n=1 Tax=Cirrhinus molitorella TaxID=172907 RepID=A0ABR3L1X4_9TELE